jgi:hypothetical protein
MCCVVMEMVLCCDEDWCVIVLDDVRVIGV